MPQTQEPPKLDPNYDYAQLPDGSYAQFKKGTPPEQMQARLTAQGLLKSRTVLSPAAAPQAAKPSYQLPKSYGFTPSNVSKNLYEGVKGTVKGTYNIGKDLLSNPNWAATMPSGQRPSTMQKYITDPAREQFAKAKEDFNAHRLLEAAGHFVASVLPVLGPVAAGIGEQAGSGDIGGATAQSVGMVAGGKAMALPFQHGPLAEFIKNDPAALRTRAALLDTKELKTADAETKDFKLSTALQVANERIFGAKKQLPDKIEQVRVAKQAKVEALAKFHDAQGHTVDAVPEITPLVQNIQARLNTQGLITGPARDAVMNVLDQLRHERDMATGRTTPIDLHKLTVSKAIGLTQGLGKIASWGSEAKVAVEPFVEKIRQGINNAIDKVDPEIGKTRAEEHRLIEARDAAREQYAKILNDKIGLARGIMYSNAPTIGVWLGLRALGLMTPITALGSVILLKTMAESAISRTTRAALYARAADLLERYAGGPATPPNAAAAPNVPQGGHGPTSLPPGLQGPANATAGHPTALPPAPGGLAPTPVPPPEFTRPKPLELPSQATRARAGSGDYVRGSVAKSTTTSKSTVETSVRNKAMLDRLDTLLERKPRSGAENNAIRREIGEIKRLLSGEAKGSEASAINKRIADRERLATKISKAAAKQVSNQRWRQQSASPEMRAIALDAGYKALAKYEGGPEMVKALQKTAKAMQKIDPSYDEVEKLTEALEVLKQIQ